MTIIQYPRESQLKIKLLEILNDKLPRDWFKNSSIESYIFGGDMIIRNFKRKLAHNQLRFIFSRIIEFLRSHNTLKISLLYFS